MLVKDLMTTQVISVRPTATVEEVAELLHKYHFTGVPVVDDKNRLMGVIMERDFITSDSKLYLPTYIRMLRDIDFVQNDKQRLSEEAVQVMNTTASDIMNPNIVTAQPNQTLQELAELFATKRVNPIPVVEDGLRLVGVISRSDLINLFSSRRITENRNRLQRPVDMRTNKVYRDIDTHFAFVSKTRASIWMLISLAFLIIGFILGVAWVISK